MRPFVMVTDALWTDRKFLALSTDARLLFMWSWMPPHSNVCGLYRASLRDLARALGAAQGDDVNGRLGRVRRALDELSGAGMVQYDAASEVLWVVNKVKHAARTKNSIAFMQREIQRVPDSPLVEAFVRKWGRKLNLAVEYPSV